MWISKEEYLGIIARLNTHRDSIESLRKEFNDVKLELKIGGLIDGDPLHPTDYLFRLRRPKYPIIKRFHQLCEAPGYEYNVTPEKEEFVKKGRKR